MIIYNVTIKVDRQIHADWLRWMQQQHIPAVMKTGCFTGHHIYRLLQDEDDGVTYAVQYAATSMESYERYRTEHAGKLQEEHALRYKDRFVASRTLMETVG